MTTQATHSVCGVCFQDEGNDPKSHICNVLCGTCGQFYGEDEMDIEGFHNSNSCDQATHSVCGVCGETTPSDQGKTTTQFGVFIEFVCHNCQEEN